MILALAAAAALVYTVPSGSMLPTLEVGQKVEVDGTAYADGDPEVGDIVVFHPPRGANAIKCSEEHPKGSVCSATGRKDGGKLFLQRIVALPGDTVAIKRGHVVRNGKVAAEPFIRKCAPGNGECRFPEPAELPAGGYFLMGDNRGASNDSRYWGPVRKAWIVGRVDE